MIPTLDKIRRSGGSISVLDGKLRIEAPAGLLTDGDKQVLAQHRETLLRLFAPAEPVVGDPYLDQERQAIQWVEDLSPAAAEVVVAQAVRDLQALAGQDQDLDQVVGSDPEQDQEPEVVEDLDAWLRDNTVEPISCDKCGSLDRWQDGGGSWHCAKCDPPIRSQILRERAGRLRRQHHASLR